MTGGAKLSGSQTTPIATAGIRGAGATTSDPCDASDCSARADDLL
jgi:hypothetical protein